jgi:ABC-type branched-subunit amino acid transport system ATPase component
LGIGLWKTINMNHDLQAAFLEMRDITKTFPGVRALDGVSLELQKGRFTRWSAKTALVSRP